MAYYYLVKLSKFVLATSMYVFDATSILMSSPKSTNKTKDTSFINLENVFLNYFTYWTIFINIIY